MYPVMLAVDKQSCLLVGGGGIALRKLNGLMAHGARVTVVAPEPIPAIEHLAEEERIDLERRPYDQGEAAGYSLVIAATDDREVNRQVYEDAELAGVWVNVVDDPPLCTFHLPARVQRGNLQIAIASEGVAPFAVSRLRKLMEVHFGHAWSEWMDAAARFRNKLRGLSLTRVEEEARYDAFFAATVDPVTFKTHVPTDDEELTYLSADGPGITDEAPAETEAPDAERSDAGLVSLVGAGPGDPGLLTLRGHRRLEAADAVVYDRLAATSLPCDLADRVELHCVGKQAGEHPVPQEKINDMLIELSRQGKRVVRLKGGDPYVFGRGSEEAEALKAAGLPFEIVPGVTSAVAVPAYAGIPVTHRGEAVRATMVTAHESAKTDGLQARWDLMAGDPHASLCGYMGVTSLPKVVDKLLAGGLDPKTPAAMISRGTTSAQHVVRAPVAELPQAILDQKLSPPALFIIGPTVRHAERLNWFGDSPLHGQRLVMVSPAGSLAETLEISGAEIVEIPLPVTPASRVVMGALPLTGCVFFNGEEVEALEEEREGLGWDHQMVAWCLSPEAAARARDHGWRKVEELLAPNSAIDVVNRIYARSREAK
jgi:uroporphyrin-III C-methyltransferase / precorrin-2 dehydrogenase / sirohydrochlorin ferrochelatase